MLILRRKKNESLLIGENIRITIVECASDGVRLAIDAPISDKDSVWMLQSVLHQRNGVDEK